MVLKWEKMNSQLSTEMLGMVCIMPSPRDLEIARLLGWYRIPLRTAPKVVDVDFLAFYQPESFGESHCWRIEFFCMVLGHELTTRSELLRSQPEHPRAQEEYYKISIGPLIPLDKPIQADHWKRITFLYTTGELFQKAARLRDLVVKSDERQLLWQSLRERAIRSNSYLASKLPEDDFELDPSILALLTGLTSQVDPHTHIQD